MLSQYMPLSCVGPSVTCRYCTKTAKRRIMLSDAKNFGEISTVLPAMGVPITAGVGSDR